jgi:glycerol-3-phosphate dehydrogenase (NAD(P)+)
MGASPLTFAGLGGLGDLVLTCTGDLSRNRAVGVKLGQGMTLDAILSEMKMVAEGVKTTKSSWNLAQREGVEMPILEQMYKVLYEDKPCSEAIEALLNRDQKGEDEFS